MNSIVAWVLLGSLVIAISSWTLFIDTHPSKTARISEGVYFASLTVLTTLSLSLLSSKMVISVGPTILWAATQWWFAYLLIALAYALYLLRLKARAIYGFVEVLVGVSAIFTSVTKPEDADLAHFLTVLGGTYIVVRGLDNFNEGLVGLRRIVNQKFWDKLAHAWFTLKFDREGLARLKSEIAILPSS